MCALWRPVKPDGKAADGLVAAYNGAATLQKALESCLVADESLQALLDVIIMVFVLVIGKCIGCHFSKICRNTTDS